jgi:hypothetical protein
LIQNKPATSAIDIDDFERAKKRAKVEKILSLSHQDGTILLRNFFSVVYYLKGIVESLDMPGSKETDKEDKLMSP